MTEFIPQREIEETAKQFLLEHHPDGSIPIPIEEIAEYEKAKAELAKYESFSSGRLPDDQTLAPYLAKPISRKFKVSEECAALRIKN